jgi:hypothetical protein
MKGQDGPGIHRTVIGTQKNDGPDEIENSCTA